MDAMSTEAEGQDTAQEERSTMNSVVDDEEFPDPLLGKTVANRYKILKKMGEGGMGTVYLAEHVTIEKKVALKVLLHEYARKQDLKERFLREAKAAASIGHENIIDITDFGDTPDRSVFFAMEFLDGADLSHAIKRDGPFAWSRAKPVLMQICRALGAAHSKEIIHRDMKPENIFLIEREGRPDFVKVLDFGIAKVSGGTDGESRLTRTGMIFGTPEYMSPEQAQGHHPDHRVDIYAVGVIMYELLTGEVPFKADTFMGILTKHIFEQPIAPSVAKPDLAIPIEAEQVILKAMAKDRDERFGSMAEMAAAIQQVSGRLTRSTSDVAPIARVMTPANLVKSGGGGKSGGTGQGLTKAQASGRGRVAEPLVDVDTDAFSGSKSKLVIGGVVAALLVAGGVAAVLLMGGEKKVETPPVKPPPKTVIVKPTPKPTPPVTPKPAVKAPEQVVVVLASQPLGATVYQGEKPVGTTPTTAALPKGNSKVVFTFKFEGYEEQRETLVPDRNNKKIVARLKKKPAPRSATAHRPRRQRPTRTRTTPAVIFKKPEPTPVKAKPPRSGKIADELRNPFAN